VIDPDAIVALTFTEKVAQAFHPSPPEDLLGGELSLFLTADHNLLLYKRSRDMARCID
jgi:hypothetical protein